MFPRWGTHITRDMCFPGGGTHITRDMCFQGGGTHITRDICFPGGEHISLGICVPAPGKHISLVPQNTLDFNVFFFLENKNLFLKNLHSLRLCLLPLIFTCM